MTLTAKAVLWLSAVGVLVALAVPRLTYSSRCSNDLSAWATLRTIERAQAELQRAAHIDLDHDGRGEFGFLAEMSGAVALPNKDVVLKPPVLSGVFRVVRPDGTAARSGYRIRVFLPDAQGNGMCEPGTPPLPPREPGEG